MELKGTRESLPSEIYYGVLRMRSFSFESSGRLPFTIISVIPSKDYLTSLKFSQPDVYHGNSSSPPDYTNYGGSI